MRLKNFYAKSSPGPYLQINEDAYDFDFTKEIYFLLDGFGGAGIGDVAVTEIKESVKKYYGEIAQDQDSTMPFYYSPKYLLEGNALINALLKTHSDIYDANVKKEFGVRAGSSGVFLVQSQSLLTIVSTGNCCCFLYRKGKLRKIILEDSYYLLGDESENGHLRSLPMSGIGLFPDLHFKTQELRIHDGDKILALSDGVYSYLTEEELGSAIGDPQINSKEKVELLFEEANRKGNLDNQSSMILEF